MTIEIVPEDEDAGPSEQEETPEYAPPPAYSVDKALEHENMGAIIEEDPHSNSDNAL